MIPAKAPPLLPSLDATGQGPGLTEDSFRALFQYLYVEANWYVTVPGGHTLKVAFRPDHFNHAFFKEPAKGEPRSVWKADRAERLLWIGYTLENPSEVYRAGSARFSFFCRLADRSAPWYLVVIEATGDWTANFVTAYPVGHEDIPWLRKNAVQLKTGVRP